MTNKPCHPKHSEGTKSNNINNQAFVYQITKKIVLSKTNNPFFKSFFVITIMKNYILLLIFSAISAFTHAQKKDKTWVFIMAGQSNMAGRGTVDKNPFNGDTITNRRIQAINQDGNIVMAREPLHFYEPKMAGLDCGLSFARTLLSFIPEDVTILLIPTAVGGSSITQWIEDSEHRGVMLWTNFKSMVEIGKKYGIFKGVLWHQGESDANATGIMAYRENLRTLFAKMRKETGEKRLPILMGELGYFSKTSNEQFMNINVVMHQYASTDNRSLVVGAKGLDHKGDNLHFNSVGQRELGRRYAFAFAEVFLK
jgi:hypothetical protein